MEAGDVEPGESQLSNCKTVEPPSPKEMTFLKVRRQLRPDAGGGPLLQCLRRRSPSRLFRGRHGHDVHDDGNAPPDSGVAVRPSYSNGLPA